MRISCVAIVSLCVLVAIQHCWAVEVTTAVDAQAQLEAERFVKYIDAFYPEGRQGVHGEMINRITQGLKRKDITLASLIQVADAMVLKSGVRAGTAVEPNSEERGPNGCLMYNGEECNGERAGTCKERTCHCIGHWTGLRCQSEWSIKRFNPYTGLSEANQECADDAANFLKGC